MGVVAVTAATALGLAGLALVASAGRPGPARPPVTPRRWLDRRLAMACAAGSAVALASGWVIPAGVVGIGAWLVSDTSMRHRTRADDVARMDALASWIEHLRDVLVAGDQPVGAVMSTVATCPPAIRPQVRRLAAGLGRQDTDAVLRHFADELDDPLGDLVVAGLMVALRRGARTVGVLTALAEQARAQADRRRLIEAERAPTRREVAALTWIMAALVLALLLLGRSEYLAAYDRPAGQLFVATALAVYGLLLVRVQRLGAFPRPGRFLRSATTPSWGGSS